MQPSEFWELSLTEFWLEFDYKYQLHKKLKSKAGQKAEGPSPAQWEAARKKFREMQNGATDRTSR